MAAKIGYKKSTLFNKLIPLRRRYNKLKAAKIKLVTPKKIERTARESGKPQSASTIDAIIT
jgi:hypothetical protein